MQRSIFNKNHINSYIYLFIFFIYESLSDIYLFLPPLFAILLILFLYNYKKLDTINIILVSIALLFFEAQKDYVAFTSIIFAILFYKLVVIKLDLLIRCNSCKKLIITLLSYPSYYIFSYVLSGIFILSTPQISWYIEYYMAIESLIILLFIKWI